MSLPKSLSCAVLALSLLLPLGAAHAAPVTYVFSTVDRYVIDWNTSRVEVRGVLQGQSAPSTVSLQFYYSHTGGNEPSDRCEKFALLSMASPGRYTFELSAEYESVSSCALTRVTP